MVELSSDRSMLATIHWHQASPSPGSASPDHAPKTAVPHRPVALVCTAWPGSLITECGRPLPGFDCPWVMTGTKRRRLIWGRAGLLWKLGTPPHAPTRCCSSPPLPAARASPWGCLPGAARPKGASGFELNSGSATWIFLVGQHIPRSWRHSSLGRAPSLLASVVVQRGPSGRVVSLRQFHSHAPLAFAPKPCR